MNLFRIRGIQLAVHGSFAILLALAAFEGWSEGGWRELLASVVLVCLFFVCVVLHELGHSFTAMRFGVRVPRIVLLPIGGMAEFDRVPKQPRQEFLITIAGPLVNVAIAAILLPLVGFPPGSLRDPEFADSWTGLGHLLLFWNLLMACFNLLPIFPMDGGRLLRSLLAVRLPYLRATWWAAQLGRGLSLAIVLTLGVFAVREWMAGRTDLVWLHAYKMVLFSFIYYAGGAEYRLTLRREQEERYLRELALRFESLPPPTRAARLPDNLHGPN